MVITDRGEPIAELKPLEGTGDERTTLERLQALGTVTRQEDRPLAALRPVRARGPAVSDAILEDRDDRA